MAYIYCITNLINGKQYVGKTTCSITKRFKEHCRDCSKEYEKNRPLYAAMNKYGIENFVVKELIECEVDELSSYEIMFIEKLGTYGKEGYNATKGGDGSILFDYNEIVKLYKEGRSMVEVASIIHCCVDTVSKVVHMYNLPINKIIAGNCQQPKVVIQLDKETEEELQTFDSVADASHWLVDNGYAKTYNGGVRQKICNCCNGTQKSAYKFKWKYKE